jgi:hypothetical protein
MLHHCAATGIPRVIEVIWDGHESANLIRVVCIEFDDGIENRHLRFVDYFASRCVPFLQRPTNIAWGGIPPEAHNFSLAVRQQLIKQELKFEDKALLPLVAYLYNSFKSGIDVTHRQMGEFVGSQVGEIRKINLAVLDMFMLSLRQSYRATTLTEELLQTLASTDELQSRLNDVGSDRSLVLQIAREFKREDFHLLPSPDQLKMLNKPRLSCIAVINENWSADDPAYREKAIKKRDDACSKPYPRTESELKNGVSDMTMWYFKDPLLNNVSINQHDWCEHQLKLTTSTNNRCVMCCEKCESEKPCTTRHGCKPKMRCDFCKAYLCNIKRKIWGGLICYEAFHQRKDCPSSHPFQVVSEIPHAISVLEATSSTSQVIQLAEPVSFRKQFKATPQKARSSIKRPQPKNLSDDLGQAAASSASKAVKPSSERKAKRAKTETKELSSKKPSGGKNTAPIESTKQLVSNVTKKKLKQEEKINEKATAALISLTAKSKRVMPNSVVGGSGKRTRRAQ